MLKTLAVLCVVAQTVLGAAAVAGPDYVWTNYSVEDGLSDNRVVSLFQSSDGSVWIGTLDGLTQYTDDRLVVYDKGGGEWSRVPVLRLQIYGICEDFDGRIWIQDDSLGCGFVSGGLIIPDSRFRLDWEGYYLSDFAAGIGTGPDGRLWGAFGDGIMWFDPATGLAAKVWDTPRYWQLDFSWHPKYLFIDSQGRVWFCSGWLRVLGPDGRLLREYPDRVGTVAESPDGSIWLGRTDRSQVGIERLEGDEFVSAGPSPPLDVVPCGPISISSGTGEMVTACRHPLTGQLWDRIYTFDGRQWVGYYFPFRGECTMRSLMIDREGLIWVGTGGAFSGNSWYEAEGVWVLRRNPPVLPAFLGVYAEPGRARVGVRQRVLIDVLNSAERTVDVYVALQTPTGSIYFYPGFRPGCTPFLTGLSMPAGTHLENYELFSLTLPDLPEGTYRWFAALTYAGTMDLASNIASCEWEFEK